jgi:sugar lactone lactonase YvrE
MDFQFRFLKHLAVRTLPFAWLIAMAGCSGSGGNAASVAPTMAPRGAEIFVANQGNNSITAYAAGAAGNQVPVATIEGSNTGLSAPMGIALDAQGNIYVANTFTVTVYAANPVGTLNEAPTATIDVNNGGVTLYGIGVDASGKIYVAYPGAIQVYAADPVGTVTTPIATIIGSNTDLAEVHNIAFDASGRIYATDNVHGIVVFAPNPSGTLNEAPVANIPRNATTGLSYPWGIAIDSSGKIYTLDSARIFVFPADPVGTISEAPLATIAGSNTQLDGGNDGLSVGPSGTIYAANISTNVISEFAANPVGSQNEAPAATITGSSTGLNGSRGVAVLGGSE